MAERETFVAFGDLLLKLALQCRAAERFLKQRTKAEAGVTVELAYWVAERQARVASGLEGCAQEGPSNMVSRRLQYKPDYQAWLDPQETEPALKQVVNLNNTVSEVLQEVTDKSVPVEVGEQMQDLTRQVDAINRKVSLALVVSSDV